jgi:hypothetical protein
LFQNTELLEGQQLGKGATGEEEDNRNVEYKGTPREES